MIQVTCAPEPAGFDATVRQRGLSAIDELVGRRPRINHSGRRRKSVAQREDDIPPTYFPALWRHALPDMLRAYERRCAFLAHYIEYATGNPSVDHMLPKSRAWQQVYEWSNYRLCAALVNAHKSDLGDLIDPFTCGAGWFELELVGFQVVVGNCPSTVSRAQIAATLRLLNLPDFCKAREEYVVNYEQHHIDFDYLQRRAPFVAAELRRQNRLHPADR